MVLIVGAMGTVLLSLMQSVLSSGISADQVYLENAELLPPILGLELQVKLGEEYIKSTEKRTCAACGSNSSSDVNLTYYFGEYNTRTPTIQRLHCRDPPV